MVVSTAEVPKTVPAIAAPRRRLIQLQLGRQISDEKTWPFHSWGSGHSLQHLNRDTQVKERN
jgi:hypothetical protein